MKKQKYTVKLSVEERKELEIFVKSRNPKNTPESKKHARVLLCLDEKGEKPLSVKETSAKCKYHEENVYALRKQYVLEGMERVLHRKKRETPPTPKKITGEVEAHIIATACSAVPEGRKAWTLSMIGKKIVLEGVIEHICPESVRLVLKKHNISHI